ncbi:FecR family protein [Chitinophaga japonensis]|uniref:FecR family protein n=1 Tax=Chitinophaga japonensis TaxID=104662 RepID=A0A562STK7_CHIJA|nr:FecR domain-containing protein [Chitinophaga japonensis]TWI84364.1 FecR family protein [Chitinophaga japonensis]
MDLEAIQQLIIEEIAGTLTPEQQTHLRQIVADNEEAAALRAAMHEALPPEKVATIRAGLDMERPGEIIAGVKRRKRKVFLLKASGIAASILLLAAICWQLLLAPAIHPGKDRLPGNGKHIALQLANGKTIDLSTAGPRVRIDNITLNNANKKLSYATDESIPQLVTLYIPAGKDYNIVLSDGTEIMLNSATTLQFPSAFTGGAREVTIQGEAFLKVAKQAGKPFLVHLPGNTVQVLGTAFNVNTYDSARVKVALVNGSVRLTSGVDSVLLKPGYLAASNGQKMQVARFDAEEVLSWQQGIYNFYNTPFSEAAAVISRWYGIDFIIDDPALNKRLFTGVIDRNQPLQQFLDNMKATNGLQYEIRDESIHIR